jgi:DNA modification methylase
MASSRAQVALSVEPDPAQRPVAAELALSRSDVWAGLLTGDVLPCLKRLPSDTFHVAVTSPPYFWARDYELDDQIGHEESDAAYVKCLADVFDEVRRVLHPEGVFYLNIADTYYSGNGQPHGEDPKSPSRNFMRRKLRPVDQSGWGIPKKSMIGIPWQVAFEMQQRGWTVRSDIIWNRVNAFAEPTARDRPHRQYEHVFLFSKSRFYSYDRSALGDEEDVWTIPIERSRSSQHNAYFPSGLVERCVLTGSPPDGYVLDPFVGSGTTLETAMELGRHSVGIDLSPSYTRHSRSRLEALGAEAGDWQGLEERLSREPAGWADWPGNKTNFRKPGTARSKPDVD